MLIATTLPVCIALGTRLNSAPERHSPASLRERGMLVEGMSPCVVLATGSRRIQCSHTTLAMFTAGRSWPSPQRFPLLLSTTAAFPVRLLPNGLNLCTESHRPYDSHNCSGNNDDNLRNGRQPVAALGRELCCTASVIETVATRHWPDGIRLLEVSEDPEIWVSSMYALTHG